MAEPIGAQLPHTGPNTRWAASNRKLPAFRTRTKLMTVLEVSTELRMSRMTIYRMIHAGELEAVPVGRKSFRIREDEFARYLREGPRTEPSTLWSRARAPQR